MVRASRRGAFALVLAGCAGAAQAQIYGGSDRNGVVVLSNFASEETPELVVSAPAPELLPVVPPRITEPAPPVLATGLADRAAAFRPVIDRVAKEVSMSPQLLHAVIRVESGYQDKVVSNKGAIGLMQLMPATAQRFGVRDAFDAAQNIRGGALYLKWLLDYFRGDLRLALAAYNAGEAAVVKAGYRIPPIAETIDYVPKVLWFLSQAANG
jgi:soluble lytic murein transglycosylase-like protein